MKTRNEISHDQIRIGILGAADIAWKRFLPALEQSKRFIFAGVAVSGEKRLERARQFTGRYGGSIYIGYEEMLKCPEIDAVYIPQPPSMHYEWAKRAISLNKHVLLEKPSTTNLKDTEELTGLAKRTGVVINENYAFCYHKQVSKIIETLKSGKLGEPRLIRTAFGFPYRGGTDFRYLAKLGGGALLDCGGYTVKAAQLFLGEGTELMAASSQSDKTGCHDVDMFGSAMFRNQTGLTVQASFGMDNYYKCELEIWGSQGYLTAPRFYTPPADFSPEIIIKGKEKDEVICVEPDDQFLHMIENFAGCIDDSGMAELARNDMLKQMRLVQGIKDKID